MNFENFLRIPFYIEHLWWMRLDIKLQLKFVLLIGWETVNEGPPV